jgi:hypothetical protein
MTSDHDVDLKDLAGDWQAAPYNEESAEEIRHYVAKRSGLLWSFAMVDAVIAGIALPVLLYFGIATESKVQRLAMIALASITIATVAFGWWNSRGVLRASATSVSEYVAISAERLRRMRLAWRIAWLVLAAQVTVYVWWIPSRLHAGGIPPSPVQLRFAWAFLAGLVLVAVVGLLWFNRWLKRDTARFEALRRELE